MRCTLERGQVPRQEAGADIPWPRAQYCTTRGCSQCKTIAHCMSWNQSHVCPPGRPTGRVDPRRRPLCTSTGPLTKCRHPFACSIITALKHQGQPYTNLDPALRRPAWDIRVQILHQCSDFFRKPRAANVRPNFISRPSPPLFHQPSYYINLTFVGCTPSPS